MLPLHPRETLRHSVLRRVWNTTASSGEARTLSVSGGGRLQTLLRLKHVGEGGLVEHVGAERGDGLLQNMSHHLISERLTQTNSSPSGTRADPSEHRTP